MTQKERIAAIEKQLRRNKGDSDIWDIDFDLPQNTWKSPRFKEDLAAMFKRNKVAASTETVEEFRIRLHARFPKKKIKLLQKPLTGLFFCAIIYRRISSTTKRFKYVAGS